MDYICNKCYCTKARTTKPFKFTQCKHIFCDNCIKEVARQCVVCGFQRPAFLTLKEPLPPEIASYFAPLNETLGLLRTTTSLQNSQLSIILERFYEIRKKYYDLKNHYCKVIQKTEYMAQECNKFKYNIEKVKEKLNYLKDISPNTASISTRSISSTNTPLQNYRFSFASRVTPEEFRVPTSSRVPKSVRKTIKVPMQGVMRFKDIRGLMISGQLIRLLANLLTNIISEIIPILLNLNKFI
ncbi:hypothetical protein M0802_002241 [Mischocyttarus mexicanus]|nr:hypothetical protein M0802_002241 [Mischocyttarus mexicanus]